MVLGSLCLQAAAFVAFPTWPLYNTTTNQFKDEMKQVSQTTLTLYFKGGGWGNSVKV